MQTPANSLTLEIANSVPDGTAAMPDLGEWIQRHYCMAGMLDSIQAMKQVWIPETNPESEAPEEEWALAVEFRDILKEYYLDEQWDYVKNCLLA